MTASAEPIIVLPPKAAARLREKFAEGPFTGSIQIEIRDGLVTKVAITTHYRGEKDEQERKG